MSVPGRFRAVVGSQVPLHDTRPMNKTQFVEAVALDSNMTRLEARKAVDAMIRITNRTLREGDRLTITGLGTFSIQHKTERVGRNPRTGAAVKIPARKVVKFRSTVEIE